MRLLVLDYDGWFGQLATDELLGGDRALSGVRVREMERELEQKEDLREVPTVFIPELLRSEYGVG